MPEQREQTTKNILSHPSQFLDSLGNFLMSYGAEEDKGILSISLINIRKEFLKI